MADVIESPMVKYLDKLPKVSSLFRLVGLKLGCTVIGYVGVASAILVFLIDLFELAIASDIRIVEGITLSGVITILALDITTEAGFVVICIILVLGVKKNKARYIFAFILAGIGLILCKICLFILSAWENKVIICIVSIIYTGFHSYYIIVVNSYFFEMDTGGQHY